MNSFWNVESLSQKTVKLTKVKGERFANTYGETNAVYFDGEPFKGEKTEVFAYLGVPKVSMPQGGYPAIVLVHGGGGMAFFEWVEYWNSKGYVAIAFDHSSRIYGSIHIESKGCGIYSKNGGPTDCFNIFSATKENYKDEWIYHSVANTLLSFNALRDTGIVNVDKIALTGISWGSVIGLIAMGLDQRFCCFAPVYGGGYLHLTKLYENLVGDNSAFDKEAYLRDFDPASYICNNHKPLHFTMGLNEVAFSTVSNAKTYKLSKGKVSYSIRKRYDHGHIWTEHRGAKNFFCFVDSVVNGNPMPFEVAESKLQNGYLSVKLNGAENAKKATFNYTYNDLNETTKNNEWQWESVELDLTDLTVKIPENATACMIEITDGNKNEFIASTEVFLLK